MSAYKTRTSVPHHIAPPRNGSLQSPDAPPTHPPAVHHKHGPELVLKVLVLLAVDAHGGEAQGAAQDGVGLGASAAAVGASKSSAGKEY